MKQAAVIMTFSCLVSAALLIPGAESQVAELQPGDVSAPGSLDSPSISPLPRGKSTILGGAIMKVDPVRDQLIVKVPGQHPVKILFDERTQVFRDGAKIPLHDLGPVDHASIQSILDGDDVFALSIHMLSSAPEGEYQGRVQSYIPETHEMTVSAPFSREPIKFLVPSDTPVTWVGQLAVSSSPPRLSDIVKGALISVSFEPDRKGRAVTSQIALLATPGAVFVFSGDLSSLDVHAGMLVLVDPRTGTSYKVSFDSASLPIVQSLHLEDHVMATAMYDGSRYIAKLIAAN
jgi:hypothetical protein